MKTRIEITHNRKESGSFFNDLFRKSLASEVPVCFANFKKRQALFSLDDQVRKYFGKNIVKKSARSVPCVDGPFESSFTGVTILSLLSATKKVLQPVDKAFITAVNRQLAMPLSAVSISSLFNAAKIKATLAINNASEICKLLRGLIGRKFNDFCHGHLVYDTAMINEKLFNRS